MPDLARREDGGEGAVIKIMALTVAELERSLAALAPEAESVAPGHYRFSVDGGEVAIEAVSLPDSRLGGGLLRLPQLRVTIRTDGLDGAARATLMRRFEIAFQRGGG